MISIFVLLIFLQGCNFKEVPNDPSDEISEEPIVNDPVEQLPVLRSLTNGLPVDDRKAKLFGVIIENSPAAWPHSGLSQADIVYEIYMEGYSVTRFLAIFSQFPEKIGPVRSARIPFVSIMVDWMIPFVHYGSAQRGLGNAYSIIKQVSWPIRFDGVSGLNDDFFFRDNGRSAPHNAYFNAKSASIKLPALEVEEHFSYDEKSNIVGTGATIVQVTYTSNNKIEYRFNDSSHHYDRYVNGKPMVDADSKSQVSVKNIIIQFANHSTVESINYVLVDLSNSGKAMFINNGIQSEGTWIRDGVHGKTSFFLSNGSALVLSPGNTWIQIVSDRVKISVK